MDGAQEGSTTPGGSHTPCQDTTCVETQRQGCVAHMPPFPACGLSEVRLRRTPGKTRSGVRGGDKIFSNLASKQSKFKEANPRFVEQLPLAYTHLGLAQ